MKRITFPAIAAALGLFLASHGPAYAADVNVNAGPAHVQVRTPSNGGHGGVTDPSGPRGAADTAAYSDDPDYADDATHSNRVLRASTVMGGDVVNDKGESLGSIEDVVIDAQSGQIRYAAVSMGGFLGMGDKLFAVPWKSLRADTRDGDHVWVLPFSKEKLENAKGFDQDNWPNMGSPQWRAENDRVFSMSIGTR